MDHRIHTGKLNSFYKKHSPDRDRPIQVHRSRLFAESVYPTPCKIGTSVGRIQQSVLEFFRGANCCSRCGRNSTASEERLKCDGQLRFHEFQPPLHRCGQYTIEKDVASSTAATNIRAA